MNKRVDGTYVFASPIGRGRVPMIALPDLGFWARYTFDNRALTSGRDLEVASQMVGWDELVSTFKRVTGSNAVFLPQTLAEWFDNFTNTDRPVAGEREYGDGSTTWKQNFWAWWSIFRDDVVKRDMEWIRKVNPGTYTLEKWMVENRYDGNWKEPLLKNVQDRQTLKINTDVVAAL
jgi:hypothetical protein